MKITIELDGPEELRALGSLGDEIKKLIIRRYKEKLAIDVTPDDVANITINELDLTMRSYWSLKEAGIDTVGKLMTCSEMDLLRLPRVGRNSIKEIKLVLAKLDLSLIPDDGNDPINAIDDTLRMDIKNK